MARVLRRDRALVAAKRPGVLILPRAADLGRDDRVLLGHDAGREGGGEAVAGHVVDQHTVAHRVAEAGLLQQVGRVGHALHASHQDDVVLAGSDQQVTVGRRPHARRTDLVDRVGADAGRASHPGRDLARRDHADARLEHLAHHDVADIVRRHLGAPQRATGGMDAELRAGERCKAAAEPAEGGARGTQDHC